LLRAEADRGVTVLLVTHDGTLADRCDRVIEISTD
jgi:predicted ABC-type transport system involved in lysophospholipase L1 biosynthesis ATPase subunit